MTEAKIGMIGLDTSHVPAFTKLLNDANAAHHVSGGRVTVAFPGGSADFEPSSSRVEGFTQELERDHGVSMLQSPEDVAEAADLIFITAVDSRTHLDYVRRVAPAGKPIFVDKPFAQTLSDAEEMIAVAKSSGVAISGGSSLRYADRLTALLGDDELGAVSGCDVFGPMAINDVMPGLLWYGCHSIEVMQRVMGIGVDSVHVVVSENADVYTFEYSDGRVATYRGIRGAHHSFGLTIHREKGFQQSTLQPGPDQRPWYAAMLAAILEPLAQNQWPLPAEDLLETMRMLEMGNSEREKSAEG